MKSMRVAATFMRGGTSKGVFFSYDALPKSMQKDKALRDRFLLRIMGSPDPYGQQIDGMGGATPSTSKVVLVQPSRRPGFDVEYLFGAVSIAEQKIDWSGNCGNLTAAVAPFAVHAGLLFPADGLARVDMWQANIGQHIVARLRIEDGEAVEHGDFELDGVAFPGAEIQLDFLESESPAGDDATSMFPTGRQSQIFAVPGFGNVQATLISSGAPTVFVRAADFGLPGHASKSEIEGNDAARHGLQAVRRLAAVAMGLSSEPESADVQSPHAPRVCFVAPPASYLTSAGKPVASKSIDVQARILSLGRLHHAMTGTGAVALAVAAAVPGTVVSDMLASGARDSIRFGHPSGTLAVGAEVAHTDSDRWLARRVSLSRSARRLMDGAILVPPGMS